MKVDREPQSQEPQQPEPEVKTYPELSFRATLGDFILTSAVPVGAGLMAFGSILTPPDYKIAGAGLVMFTTSVITMLRQHKG